MTALQEFRLPDVGEGLDEAEIVAWRVAVGDAVQINQVLVEIETAKSLVELPSPFAGVVRELVVPAGQATRVGSVIIRIGDSGSEPGHPDAAAQSVAPARAARTEVLVGSGPRAEDGRRSTRAPRSYGRTRATGMSWPGDPPSGAVPLAAPGVQPGPTPRQTPQPQRALAKPPVRKLARDLGVDLERIGGTGPDGSITRADVHAAATSLGVAPDGAGRARVADRLPQPPDPRETRSPIRGVRRATAEAMVASAFTAPHVTEFVTVDVSESARLLKRLRGQREFAELRLSPMTLLARAMCLAARRTPEINSYWDDTAQEIVVKHYVNLGIASATNRGLLVPNVKDADRLGLPDLARTIADAVDAARTGRATAEQMTGGTMTITNIGVFGVDSGTPILAPGESAIVCLGAVAERPWAVDGQLAVRQVTTLGLSFDHRLIDGAQGSRFLADVASMMAEPTQALVWA